MIIMMMIGLVSMSAGMSRSPHHIRIVKRETLRCPRGRRVGIERHGRWRPRERVLRMRMRMGIILLCFLAATLVRRLSLAGRRRRGSRTSRLRSRRSNSILVIRSPGSPCSATSGRHGSSACSFAQMSTRCAVSQRYLFMNFSDFRQLISGFCCQNPDPIPPHSFSEVTQPPSHDAGDDSDGPLRRRPGVPPPVATSDRHLLAHWWRGVAISSALGPDRCS